MSKLKVLFLSVLFSSLFILSCGENKQKNLTPAVPVAVVSPYEIDASPANVEKGKSIYLLNCSPCHGNGGKGDGPAAAALNPKPRNHTDSTYMNKLTNQHLFELLKNGGASKGFPLMPSFGATLKDDEIKQTIAFVRTLSNPNK